MKLKKNLVNYFFTFLFMIILFSKNEMNVYAVSDAELNNAHASKVEINYRYPTDGSDQYTEHSVWVYEIIEEGTTWNEFFESYNVQEAIASLESKSSLIQNWDTYYLNKKYSSWEELKSELGDEPIKVHSSEVGNAILTFNANIGYIDMSGVYGVYQDGKYIIGGISDEITISNDILDNDEELIKLVLEKKNELNTYIDMYSNIKGAEITVSIKRNEYTHQIFLPYYCIDITIPSGEYVLEEDCDSNDDKEVEKKKEEKKEEPQTSENNYGVFNSTTITEIDNLIASAEQQAQANSTNRNSISINTGVWISFKGDVYQKMQDSGLPVQITFMYKGEWYRVDIPANADLMSLVDENGYCGFLNLMAHFGGTKL